MKTRFRLLITCLVLGMGIFSSAPVLAGPRLQPLFQEETLTPTPAAPSPAEVIE